MGAVLVRHEPPSAGTVRHAIARELVEQGVSADAADMVLLVASELISNAVRHCPRASADDTIAVTWDFDDSHVTIRVHDASTALPYRRVPLPTEPYGRGLTIVAAAADDWGIELADRGKQVWARVPVWRPAGLHAVPAG